MSTHASQSSATRIDEIRSIINQHATGASEHEPQLEFVALDPEGIVQVRIPGCGCCPASALPWVESLQRTLKQHVSGVRLVEVVP